VIQDNPQTLIASVQRALQLIDIVANAARPLPVKAVAHTSGLSLGTTYNITRTLIHEGYLASEPDGLVLGPRFPGLRTDAGEDGVFLAKVRATLRLVAKELGYTAYLSRYSHGEIYVVDIVACPASPGDQMWVGMSGGAQLTAVTKQILIHLSAAERTQYLDGHPSYQLGSDRTYNGHHRLIAQLDSYPKHTVEVHEFAVGSTCVAVPVEAPGVVASLAISVPSDRVAEGMEPGLAPLIAGLESAASRLSMQLGRSTFTI
jgi:DNA-binding IclR family transcriptional regulator